MKKKNGQYVGVDEKYIPEEEKYIDSEASETINGVVNDTLKDAANYLGEKENQEKIKRTGKNILKGVGIFYIAIFLIALIVFLLVFVFIISRFIKFF